MGSFTASWPDRVLSPNARRDRRNTQQQRNTQRKEWWALAMQARVKGTHIALTFCPPDGRGRDLDNMLASVKSGLDGLSDAMGIDDKHFSFSIRRGDPDRPRGRVEVEVSAPMVDLELRGVVT